MSVIDKIQINSTTYDVAADAGNVAYSDAATYPDGSAGKEISQLKSDIVDLTSDVAELNRITISNYSELVDALTNDAQNVSYNCGAITVTESINYTLRAQNSNKVFIGGIFTLNSDLLTWATPSDYHASPDFIGCTFIGNGHSLFVSGAYVLGGKFVNCKFVDCSIVSSGKFVQSMRFVNCYIENTAGNTFIQAQQVYDTRFIACQAEAANKAIIVDANGTTTNTATINQLGFVECIFEGQSNYIVQTHDCDITIYNCYTEANTKPFVKALASNRTANGIFNVSIDNTRMNTSSDVYFVEVDSSYENSVWAFFKCVNSSMSQGIVINTNNLWYCVIDGIRVDSGGKRVPASELSYIYKGSTNTKNSVADFYTAGHCLVKKFPCLITFDSSDGGWHTNLYFVSLSYGNTPFVKCISDASKTPTATYDSETGFVDVTLHANRGAGLNASAVLLTGLINNLARRDAYDASISGY